jgi:hypothetical protein
VVGKRDRPLLEVVLALHPPRRLAGRLDGREEKAHQRADDGDHHEEFDEGEAAAKSPWKTRIE